MTEVYVHAHVNVPVTMNIHVHTHTKYTVWTIETVQFNQLTQTLKIANTCAKLTFFQMPLTFHNLITFTLTLEIQASPCSVCKQIFVSSSNFKATF